MCCNKNYQKNFDENLKKRLANTEKFANQVHLLLRKRFYAYKFMDDWENWMKHYGQKKEDFYSHLEGYWWRLRVHNKSL